MRISRDLNPPQKVPRKVREPFLWRRSMRVVRSPWLYTCGGYGHPCFFLNANAIALFFPCHAELDIGSWAQPVTVQGEFFNNPKSKNFFFRRMVQNVKTHERRIQLRIFSFTGLRFAHWQSNIEIRYRISQIHNYFMFIPQYSGGIRGRAHRQAWVV